MAFCVWLIPLSIMFLRLFHLVKFISTSFLFMTESYSIVGTCCISFIHSSLDGCLGCFHLLAVVYKYLNMRIQVFESLFSILVGIELDVQLLGHVV